MSKRLPLVTTLLIAASLLFAALIAKELTTTQRLPAARPQSAATPVAAAPQGETTPAAAASAAAAYTVIATRNLFSPTRTEAPPPPPTPAGPPVPVNLPPKPNLYGIVLQDGTPVAYLEDPATRRVARYRVGDTVAGGTVKTISSDNVVLTRPDGQISVRLHDPTRPRSTAPMPGAPAVGGSPAGPPALPGTVKPQSLAPPGAPSQGGPPSRRQLPPSVLGRALPQGTNAPAPQ